MQTNFGRVALGALAVIAAVVLLIVLQDDGGDGEANDGATTTAERSGSGQNGGQQDKPSKPAVPTIVIRGGKPVGGVEELTFEAGERVRFAVESNAADEVHVHGYDIEKELRPGRRVEFDFPASLEGVFEAELHGSGEQIAELRIEP